MNSIHDADALLVTYCQLIVESRTIMQRIELLKQLRDAIDGMEKAVEG